MVPIARIVAVLLGASAVIGCPSVGLIDDGTSVSYGPSNRGTLLRPARLPGRGQGYEIPEKWRTRGLVYGTDELVALVVYAGRRVAAEMPGAVLQVADLSRRRGGPSAWHRSHQTGRDADFLFFVRDASGKRVRPADMIHFDAHGRAVVPDAGNRTLRAAGARSATGTPPAATGHLETDPAGLQFDVASNWFLVRTLIENPVAELQYIFIYDELRQRLLDHARRTGAPEDVIARASYLLRQPGDSAPHDDHMHVRIYCAASDRVLGCHDRGSLRWVKKNHKYDPEPRPTGVARAAVAILRRSLTASAPAVMALAAPLRLP